MLKVDACRCAVIAAGALARLHSGWVASSCSSTSQRARHSLLERRGRPQAIADHAFAPCMLTASRSTSSSSTAHGSGSDLRCIVLSSSYRASSQRSSLGRQQVLQQGVGQPAAWASSSVVPVFSLLRRSVLPYGTIRIYFNMRILNSIVPHSQHASNRSNRIEFRKTNAPDGRDGLNVNE